MDAFYAFIIARETLSHGPQVAGTAELYDLWHIYVNLWFFPVACRTSLQSQAKRPP